jgi:hypothetical protein
VGYATDSQLVEDTTATKDHKLTLENLSPETKYFFTIVLSNGTQECEHPLTTQAIPPTPTPTPLITPSPTSNPIPFFRGVTADCLDPSQCPPDTGSFLTRIAHFLTSGRGLTLSEWLGILVAALVTLTFGQPGFLGFSTFMTTMANMPNALLHVLTPPKRKRGEWGRVVSSVTTSGIQNAQVALYDALKYNKLVGQTVTDASGRFGFMVPPGTYTMAVAHAGYAFPSTARTDGYHGTPFTVPPSGLIQVDVPLDPTALTTKLWQELEALAFKLEVLRVPLLIAGTILTTINLHSAITLVNLLFLTYYSVLWYWEWERKDDSRHVLTVTDTQNQPIPFAILRLTNSKGDTILTKATTTEGKVFFLVSKGDYTATITPPATNPTLTPQTLHLTLQRGYLTHPLKVQLK